VDFELSDDQRALQEAASALLGDRCPTTRVRTVADESDHLDADLWAAMAEQGWPAVELPEAAGGLGLGLVETVVLCEQLGRHLAPVPFLGTVLAGLALTWAEADGEISGATSLGDDDVAGWIERLSTGDAIGAVAWSRRPGAVTARSDGGGWTASGRSDLVVYGSAADLVVVFAEADGRRSGLSPSRPWTGRAASVGWSSPTGPSCAWAAPTGPGPCSTGPPRRRRPRCSAPPSTSSR
jgi:alkylation response protein AidB-like acyl-CoA dehydrogenase